MRRSASPASDPHEWLRRARSNLIRSELSVPGACLEDLCFDAQQAAEKAIKAVFVHRQLTYPYIHDLARLFSALQEAGIPVPKYLHRSEALTDYAVLSRYPGLAKPVTPRQHKTAVRLAHEVYRWASRMVATANSTSPPHPKHSKAP